MEELLGIITIIIIVLGICVVLPIMIVWIINKRKSHEIDKKTEILTILLEKKPDMDPTEAIKKLNLPQVKHFSVKKSLLERLMGGIMITLMGAVILIAHLCDLIFLGEKSIGIIGGGTLMAVGIACLIYYFAGKRMLRNEIEMEERQMEEQNRTAFNE